MEQSIHGDPAYEEHELQFSIRALSRIGYGDDDDDDDDDYDDDNDDVEDNHGRSLPRQMRSLSNRAS